MNGNVTYERQNFCSQGFDCFEIYWIGLVHMVIFLFNAKSIIGGVLINSPKSV